MIMFLQIFLFLILILVLILICLVAVKIKLEVSYNDGLESIVLHYGWIKYKLPLKAQSLTEDMEAENSADTKVDLGEMHTRTEERIPPSVKEDTTPINEETSSNHKPGEIPKKKKGLFQEGTNIDIGEIIQYLNQAREGVILLVKKFYIEELVLEVSVSKGDPFDTAIFFGHVSGYVYSALAVFQNLIQVSCKEMKVYPDFKGDVTHVICSFFLVVRPITLIPTLIKLGIISLKQFIKLKRKCKYEPSN